MVVHGTPITGLRLEKGIELSLDGLVADTALMRKWEQGETDTPLRLPECEFVVIFCETSPLRISMESLELWKSKCVGGQVKTKQFKDPGMVFFTAEQIVGRALGHLTSAPETLSKKFGPLGQYFVDWCVSGRSVSSTTSYAGEQLYDFMLKVTLFTTTGVLSAIILYMYRKRLVRLLKQGLSYLK